MTARVAPLTSSSDDPSVTLSPAEHWQALFGSAAPARQARLIEHAIAWKCQVIAESDVSSAIRRDLGIAADQAREARGQGSTPAAETGEPAGSDPPATSKPTTKVLSPTHSARSRSTAPLPPASSQLTVGTRLVKSYGDKTHVVEVTGDGLRYNGHTYGSLSAIAKVITGTHWNGLLFFGLRKRRTYPKAKS